MDSKYLVFQILRNLANFTSNDVNKTTNSTNFGGNDDKQKIYIYIVFFAVIIICAIIILFIKLHQKYLIKKIFKELDKINLLGAGNVLENKEYLNDVQNTELKKSSINLYQKIEDQLEELRKKYGNEVCILYLIKNNKIIIVKYEEKYIKEFDEMCTICLEKFQIEEFVCITPCEHIFHKECLLKSLNAIKNKDKLKCPNCNQNLLINKIYLSKKTNKKITDLGKIKSSDNLNNSLNMKSDDNNCDIKDEKKSAIITLYEEDNKSDMIDIRSTLKDRKNNYLTLNKNISKKNLKGNTNSSVNLISNNNLGANCKNQLYFTEI